jgi:hypothetical protein
MPKKLSTAAITGLPDEFYSLQKQISFHGSEVIASSMPFSFSFQLTIKIQISPG